MFKHEYAYVCALMDTLKENVKLLLTLFFICKLNYTNAKVTDN